jgi:CDP-glucose 4,6-dehydratase
VTPPAGDQPAVEGGSSRGVTGWRGRRALVTGATGFVGSWLVRRLLDCGAEVTALVRAAQAESPRVRDHGARGARVVVGRVEDLECVRSALAAGRVETVFHLAADNVNVGSEVSPLSLFETNIRGTYSLLEACRGCPAVHGVILASSAEADGGPAAAGEPARKRHPYEVSKVSAELIARSYADTYGLPLAIARSDNVYGGGDFNWRRLIPGTILALHEGRRPTLRSDGTLRRDYVFVRDMVEAYLRLAERLDDAAVRGGVFHFATGIGTSALEVVDRLGALMERPDLEPDVTRASLGERVDRARSTERELRLLGWRSETGLEAGLAETVRWYEEHFARDEAAKSPPHQQGDPA